LLLVLSLVYWLARSRRRPVSTVTVSALTVLDQHITEAWQHLLDARATTIRCPSRYSISAEADAERKMNRLLERRYEIERKAAAQ
jgi:hypothetical protein